MTAEPPANSPDPESPGPMPARRPSELSRAVAECRVYLHERETERARRSDGQRFTGRPAVATAMARPFCRLAKAAVVVGDAAAGVLSAVIGAVADRLPRGSTFLRIVRSRRVGAVAAAGLIGAVGFFIVHEITRQQRQAAAVNQLATQFRDLRARSADEARWTEFTQQARQDLDEIVPALEAAADAGDRASIDLLWAARDYLPKMLTDARHAPSEAERQFNVCMRRVRGRGPSRE